MSSISPTTFGVTGTGFTPNGSVSINIIGSSGSSSVYSFNTTANGSGGISASVASSFLSTIGAELSSGTSTKLYVYAIDQSTSTQSNTVSFTLTNNSVSTPAFMSDPEGMYFSVGNNSNTAPTVSSPFLTLGYTYSENFSGSSAPYVVVYASANSDMSNPVQIGGVSIGQIYWNTPPAQGGQASTSVGNISVNLGGIIPLQAGSYTIYIVAVDTTYNVRSAVASLGIYLGS